MVFYGFKIEFLDHIATCHVSARSTINDQATNLPAYRIPSVEYVVSLVGVIQSLCSA